MRICFTCLKEEATNFLSSMIIHRPDLEPNYPFFTLSEHCVVGITDQELGKEGFDSILFSPNVVKYTILEVMVR